MICRSVSCLGDYAKPLIGSMVYISVDKLFDEVNDICRASLFTMSVELESDGINCSARTSSLLLEA